MHLLLLATILLAAPPAASVRSEHYEIRAPEAVAGETGRLLDQLHADLAEFFGRQPDGPLRIILLADREAFDEALVRDRHPAVDAGGYYGPENRTVYLFIQPSTYYTRQLLLHEATHQFHFLAATENHALKAAWYMEGLAEYFAMHNWDGAQLHCGTVPAVSLEDYPAVALAAFEASADRVAWMRRVIRGEEPLSRPVSWALVHFLIHRNREAFRRLGSRLDRGDSPLEAFQETIGPVGGELADEFHRWISGHQQPWSVVWIEWQQSGQTLEGWSQTVGLLIHKQPLARLELAVESQNSQNLEESLPQAENGLDGQRFEIRSKDPVWKAGAVFGYRGVNDFYLAQLDWNHQIQVLHRIGSQWHLLLTTRQTAATDRLLIECLGDRVRIFLGGTPIYDQVAPGQLGLHIDACHASFRSEGR